jgi:hypothetical protein
MTPESRNSSLLENSSLGAFPHQRKAHNIRGTFGGGDFYSVPSEVTKGGHVR